MIQKPYTLAEIPRDITGASGNILSGDVFAVTGSKKRKRTELALAIDREGVNIYDVQSSKTITSYAISPQAVFTCPPCSIRYRKRGIKPAIRYTYCSIMSPIPRILCFAEGSGTKDGPRDQIISTSVNLNKKASPVVHLDTFHVGTKDGNSFENKLVAVHEDGTFTIYSENLECSERLAGLNKEPLAQELPRSACVQLATVLSLEQARKTILKNREDLLAAVEKGSHGLDSSLLLLISRSPQPSDESGHNSLCLKISTLHAANPDTNAVPATGSNVREIATLAIPEPKHARPQTDIFNFHTASGTLYQLGQNVMIIYDLTGSIPQITHEMTLASTLSACLQLSPGLLACSNPRTLSIVDSTYYSLQDTYSFLGESGASITPKTSEAADDQPVNEVDAKLLSYFAPLNLVVVLGGRKLLAIHLSSTTLHDGRLGKRKRDASLAASLGKGCSLATKNSFTPGTSEPKIKSLGAYLPSNTTNIDSISQSAELDPRSPQFDADQFQIAALQALVLRPAARCNSRREMIADKGKIYQLLSRTFAVEKIQQTGSSDTDVPHKLKVLFLQRETCNSLIEVGFFTAHHIEIAMKHHGAMPFTSKLVPGALVQALATWDSSLEILSSIMASPLPLDSGELVFILAIVTRTTQDSEVMGTTRLLTNGGLNDGSDENASKMQLTNGEALHNPSTPGLYNGAFDHRLLNLTLRRLFAISSSSVTRALQTGLSTHQLRILVDTLRLEIARSGWLSPYDDSLDSIDHKTKDNNQICYIAHLLNCAIDSVGSSGWILGTSMSDESTETADTIGYMKAEISAALEGIEEATYLKGMLGEILLCGKNSLQSSAKPSRFEQAHLAPLAVKPLTLSLDGHDNGVLPLGLKPAPVISNTKVGAGGELIRRSARDIGRLKSKAVGKYSFDRIMI